MIDFSAMSALEPSATDLSPRPRPEALEFLLTRRSTPSKLLTAPGPAPEQLALLLRAASRVPDHGKLAPWRFIVVADDARGGLAHHAAEASEAAGRTPEDTEKTRAALLEAPTLVVVVAAPVEHPKIPEVEQLLAAGLAAANLVYAALAAGFGAQWLTGWAAHDADFTHRAFGLAPKESVVAFVHIGAARSAPPERPRPDIGAIAETLTAETLAARTG